MTTKFSKEFLALLPAPPTAPKDPAADLVRAIGKDPPKPKRVKRGPPVVPYFGIDARSIRQDVELRPEHYEPEQIRTLERVEKREDVSQREAIDLVITFMRASELRRAAERLQKKRKDPEPEEDEVPGSFEKQDFGPSIVLA